MTEVQGTTVIAAIAELQSLISAQSALMATRDAWLMIIGCSLLVVVFLASVQFVRGNR